MKVELKEMRLRNFRCFDDRTFSFGHNTVIRGTNGTGKSTLFDAFTFTLFGKDSNGRTDFGYKRRDNSGAIVHKVEYGCEVVFDIDGEEKRFERVVVEKWTKPRGSKDEVLSGNECVYYVDRVRCATKKEYDAAVAGIVSEDVFRIMTDVYFFMSQKDDYKKAMLMKMAYGTSDTSKADELVVKDVFAECPQFAEFVNQLNGSSVKDFNAKVAAQISAIKSELAEIPTKISAKKEAMPPEEDWDAIEGLIEGNRIQLKEVDSRIADENARKAGATEELNKLRSDVSNKQLELLKRENAIRAEVMSSEGGKRQALADADAKYTDAVREYNRNDQLLKSRKQDIEGIVNRYDAQISSDRAKIESLNTKVAAMREQYKAIKNGTYSYADDELSCPTCHRPYDLEQLKEQKLSENVSLGKKIVTVDIAQLQEEVSLLEQKKQSEISAIEKEIAGIEESMKQCRSTIDVYYKQKEELAYQPTDVNKLIANDEECRRIREEIEGISTKISLHNTEQQPLSYLAMKKEIEDKLQGFQQMLGSRETIVRIKEQIAELEGKKSSLNDALAGLEKQQDEAKEFQKAKDRQLLERVNRLFSIVTWDFVSEQYNGNDRIACNCYVDGIPYAERNHAGQVNAGLDIINALSRTEGVCLPIFIDNAESVVEYIPTESQKILLTVDPSCSELKFEI